MIKDGAKTGGWFMSDSYKHSYIVGENLLNSLSVYNVGYQKCDPEYQWGPGVRDHYCIHHIFSGSGSYMIGEKQIRLKEGDTFILYPGVEVRYCADREKPCIDHKKYGFHKENSIYSCGKDSGQEDQGRSAEDL